MQVDKKIVVWLNISIVVLFLMIIIGGITRLTDSGLSMVTWKPVTGILPPIGEYQWQESFNEYKAYPEYKLINYNISLSDYKYIYFWEYIHRLLGRLIGILFLIPFVFFLYKDLLNKQLIKKLLIVFFMGGFQGFLGWYMVKSGLVDIPHVSHYRLAIHLTMAFLILSYIYKLKLSILFTKSIKRIKDDTFYVKLLTLILLLLFIQVVYGAFNAGIKTVNIVNVFPFYNGGLKSAFLGLEKSFFLFFLDNDYGVQFVHRSLAFVLVVLISFFIIKTNKVTERIKLENQYLFVLISFQCIIGILTLVTKAAVVFAILHQFLAIATILFVIKIKHKLRYEN